MKSFTIKCNECGKETNIFIGNIIKYGREEQGYKCDNDNITITQCDYGGEIGIYCTCGNEIEE